MIVHTKDTYKCEHCRKLYQIKSACEKHIPKCRKNPENIPACFGCEHLDKIDIELCQFDHNGCDHYSERKILYCNKLKKGVHPMWVDGYLEEDIDCENVVMPKTCEFKKIEVIGNLPW